MLERKEIVFYFSTFASSRNVFVAKKDVSALKQLADKDRC